MCREAHLSLSLTADVCFVCSECVFVDSFPTSFRLNFARALKFALKSDRTNPRACPNTSTLLLGSVSVFTFVFGPSGWVDSPWCVRDSL